MEQPGQKINKDTEELKNTINQQNSHYRTSHPIKAKHIFFKPLWIIHQDKPHPVPEKKSLKKLKRHEII